MANHIRVVNNMIDENTPNPNNLNVWTLLLAGFQQEELAAAETNLGALRHYDVGVDALNIDMDTWNRYTTENSDVFSYVQSEAVEVNRNQLRENANEILLFGMYDQVMQWGFYEQAAGRQNLGNNHTRPETYRQFVERQRTGELPPQAGGKKKRRKSLFKKKRTKKRRKSKKKRTKKKRRKSKKKRTKKRRTRRRRQRGGNSECRPLKMVGGGS